MNLSLIEMVGFSLKKEYIKKTLLQKCKKKHCFKKYNKKQPNTEIKTRKRQTLFN